MHGTDTYYTPKDIKMALDIGDSTLRKWCLAIEENDFFFDRTDNNRRIFSDRDLVMLKHFKNLVQVQNMSAKNASIIVVSKYKNKPSFKENSENSVPQVRSDNENMEEMRSFIEEQRAHIEKQEEFNRMLLDRLEEQQRYIDERLESRDQKLLETMNQMQEQKKLELEQKDKELEEEKNKSIWSRLFNK